PAYRPQPMRAWATWSVSARMQESPFSGADVIVSPVRCRMSVRGSTHQLFTWRFESDTHRAGGAGVTLLFVKVAFWLENQQCVILNRHANREGLLLTAAMPSSVPSSDAKQEAAPGGTAVKGALAHVRAASAQSAFPA